MYEEEYEEPYAEACLQDEAEEGCEEFQPQEDGQEYDSDDYGVEDEIIFEEVED